MKDNKINLSKNLIYLRRKNRLSIEQVAGEIGVSRQAVGKWETGETLPDLVNCDMLARMYDVSIDDLIYFDSGEPGGIPPKNKHIFGTTIIGARGQVVIPKAARDILGLKEGDRLVVLGDSSPENRGIALIHADSFLQAAKEVYDLFYPGQEEKP